MIPVHAPVFGVEDLDFAQEALATGEISGSAGRFIGELEQRFAEYCGCTYGIAVSSGSTALHLAFAALDLAKGDEVLCSASTNIASANAVVQQGGIIAPIDCERDTWCMDPHRLAEAVTPRTKAILPVHLFGHPVNMDAVMDLAEKFGLMVVEDCAEAHGAEFKGQRVGSFGDFGCFSFYANKVITCGEGGMLVTNNKVLADRARSLRNLAFGTPRFLHEEVGFNYRLTNLQAAIALGQLGRINEILDEKRRVAMRYLERLGGVPGLRLPVEREDCRNIYWMFALVIEQEFGVARDDFMVELRDFGVDTRTMFCPMNQQPALMKRGAVRRLPCPEADFLWTNGLYLPSGCGLTNYEIDAICHVIQEMSPACV